MITKKHNFYCVDLFFFVANLTQSYSKKISNEFFLIFNYLIRLSNAFNSNFYKIVATWQVGHISTCQVSSGC